MHDVPAGMVSDRAEVHAALDRFRDELAERLPGRPHKLTDGTWGALLSPPRGHEVLPGDQTRITPRRGQSYRATVSEVVGRRGRGGTGGVRAQVAVRCVRRA